MIFFFKCAIKVNQCKGEELILLIIFKDRDKLVQQPYVSIAG